MCGVLLICWYFTMVYVRVVSRNQWFWSLLLMGSNIYKRKNDHDLSMCNFEESSVFLSRCALVSKKFRSMIIYEKVANNACLYMGNGRLICNDDKEKKYVWHKMTIFFIFVNVFDAEKGSLWILVHVDYRYWCYDFVNSILFVNEIIDGWFDWRHC